MPINCQRGTGISRWDPESDKEIQADVVLVYRIKTSVPLIIDALTGEWRAGY
ncbi:MAG: hypothetical protein ACOY9Y_01795 [Bacillota bacterium]